MHLTNASTGTRTCRWFQEFPGSETDQLMAGDADAKQL